MFKNFQAIIMALLNRRKNLLAHRVRLRVWRHSQVPIQAQRARDAVTGQTWKQWPLKIFKMRTRMTSNTQMVGHLTAIQIHSYIDTWPLFKFKVTSLEVPALKWHNTTFPTIFILALNPVWLPSEGHCTHSLSAKDFYQSINDLILPLLMGH